MKKFVEPEIIEVEIKDTAFGPISPDVPDSEKFAVKDENDNIIGWKKQFGTASK